MRASDFISEGQKYTVYDKSTNKVIKPNVSKAEADKLKAKNKNYASGSPSWVHDKLNEADMQKISMAQAFGSNEYNIIKDLGFKFVEKPSYFQDLWRNPISSGDLYNIELALEQEGYELKEYSDKQIFGYPISEEHSGPQKSVRWKPEENVFVIHMSRTGNTYLVDKQGASSYIRFWLGVKQ